MRFNLDEKYRHYKKDSRFVMDLYTITYDTHEKLENLPELHDIHTKVRNLLFWSILKYVNYS